MDEITPIELKEKIESDEDFLLLDVRDPFEKYQANIEYENTLNIQADQLENRLDELEADKDEEIICMCRAGGRSAESRELLKEKGYQQVKSLQGGINQWAKELDERMPVY